MAQTSNALQQMIGGFGGALGMNQGLQQQQMLQNLNGNYFATGTTTNLTYVVENHAYVSGAATKAKAPVETPREGEFRRGGTAPGTYRYSDNPMAWLDERVDEMRVCLAA